MTYKATKVLACSGRKTTSPIEYMALDARCLGGVWPDSLSRDVSLTAQSVGPASEHTMAVDELDSGDNAAAPPDFITTKPCSS